MGLAGTQPHYADTGHLVYGAADGSVRAVSFDVTSLEVRGNPGRVLDADVVKASGPTFSGAANFSISDNGRLVYLPNSGGIVSNLTSRLVLAGRDGARTSVGDVDGWAWFPRFSPDGTRVAFTVSQSPLGMDANLWVLDVRRGAQRPLTFGGSNSRSFYPVWSPDGARLAYAEVIGGETNRVLVTSADGSGDAETLLDRDEGYYPLSWSPDGSTLALRRQVRGVDGVLSRDLTIFPMDGSDSAPVPFLSSPFEEASASFAPNGRWLAYVSDESGQHQIYVRPYPGPGATEIVSTSGGREAVWGPDGDELFYRNGDQLMVVEVGTGETFSAEAPTLHSTVPYSRDHPNARAGPNYDISRDGEFIFVEQDSPPSAAGQPTQINVVLDWHQELLDVVPIP